MLGKLAAASAGILVLAVGHAQVPAHYDVSASIAPNTGEMTAEVTITLPPEEATPNLAFVLGKRFKIDSVKIEPRAKLRTEDFTLFNGTKLHKMFVRFDRPLASPAKLRFKYHGPLGGPEDTDRLGFTADAMELSLELFWVPLRSELDMRYTADTTLRGIPQSKVVVAQGQIERAGDTVRLHRAVADLDLPIVAAEGLKAMTAPGMEFYARDPDEAVSQFALQRTVSGAEFMQKWLGPIPGAPARVVIVPRNTGGAYARIGYIVTAYKPTPDKPPPEELAKSQSSTMAHEIAHAWWSQGDTLSEDYWLTESFAEYSALRYVEAQFGHVACEKRLAKMRESLQSAGPILGGKRPSKVALYEKGPVLLFDLEDAIGRVAMDRIFTILARKPPRRTSEFLAVLSDVAGPDAARDFEAKLRAT